MIPRVNPSISVDCVVFGFDGKELKVVLIDLVPHSGVQDRSSGTLRKLPGSLILENEEVDAAAQRTLNELTGLTNVFLRQYAVFSNPSRISREDDLHWIEQTYGVKVTRIVTIAYYALITIQSSKLRPTAEGQVGWHSVQDIRSLAFDHKQILVKALEELTHQLLTEPIAFELLHQRFTIRQLQNLYEAITGVELDNRNFRKKILKFSFLKPIGSKEKNVAHKPAQLYRFDKSAYEKELKRNKLQLKFIRPLSR